MKMLNHQVPWSEKVKYVGVILDAEIRWKPAIADRINKAHNTLRMLYLLINKNSSLRTTFKLLLYKMCAKSALLYAASVWAAAARAHLDKLQKVQNKFLRIIYDPPRYIRTANLHQQAQIVYIDTAIVELFSHVLKSEHNNSLISNIFSYKLEDIPLRLRCRIPIQFSPPNKYLVN